MRITNTAKPYLTLGVVVVAALLFSAAASLVLPTQGGTGLNTSASTGVAQVSSGTWSVSTALANGTSATTQAFPDVSTDVATDQFVFTAQGISSVTTGGIIGGYFAGTAPSGDSPTPFYNNGTNSQHLLSSFSYYVYGPTGYFIAGPTAAGANLAGTWETYYGTTTATVYPFTVITVPSNVSAGSVVQPLSNLVVASAFGTDTVLLWNQAGAAFQGNTLGGFAWNVIGVNAQPMTWNGGGSGQTVAASATEYIGPSQSTALQSTESSVYVIVPYAATLSKVCVNTAGTQNAGGTVVATARVNGASPGSGPAATVTAGGASGFYCDFAHTASVSSGQYIDYQITNNYSGGASAAIYEITMELAPSGAGPTALILFPAMGSLSNGNYYWPYTFASGGTATEANARGPLPRAGTVKNLGCVYTSAPSASWTVALLDNGSSVGPSVTIPTTGSGTQTVTDSTHTYAASAFDAIDLKVTGSGTAPGGVSCSLEMD